MKTIQELITEGMEIKKVALLLQLFQLLAERYTKDG